MDDKEFNITPITATEYSTAVFINLISLLDKKGLLSVKEIGEALLKDAADSELPNRDEGAVAYIEALGRALLERAPKRDAP